MRIIYYFREVQCLFLIHLYIIIAGLVPSTPRFYHQLLESLPQLHLLSPSSLVIAIEQYYYKSGSYSSWGHHVLISFLSLFIIVRSFLATRFCSLALVVFSCFHSIVSTLSSFLFLKDSYIKLILCIFIYASQVLSDSIFRPKMLLSEINSFLVT